jgi:hypothetical protein
VSTSHQHVITAGRAYVRLIEAADALLGYRPAWTEALLSRRLRGLARALHRHRLRELIGALPAEMGAEIWAASEKIEGRCRRLGRTEARRRLCSARAVNFALLGTTTLEFGGAWQRLCMVQNQTEKEAGSHGYSRH